jgi:CheY-like chemotaxis protein
MSETENPFESRPRIFVVDDELEIAKMLTVVLQMNLFDAIAYTDPHEALEAAKAAPPDYIISDIVMPGLTGIELAIRVRTEIPTCKILLSQAISARRHLSKRLRPRVIPSTWWKSRFIPQNWLKQSKTSEAMK